MQNLKSHTSSKVPSKESSFVIDILPFFLGNLSSEVYELSIQNRALFILHEISYIFPDPFVPNELTTPLPLVTEKKL